MFHLKPYKDCYLLLKNFLSNASSVSKQWAKIIPRVTPLTSAEFTLMMDLAYSMKEHIKIYSQGNSATIRNVNLSHQWTTSKERFMETVSASLMDEIKHL